MTKVGKVAITLISITILFFLLCFRVVGVGNIGIVTQFGNVNREWSSGVHLKLPWPIESLTTMNVQVQKEQQDANAATHDLQSVTATVAVNYHLTSDTAQRVYKEVGVNYKSVVIDPIIQEAVKSTTAGYDASDLTANRPAVENKLTIYLTGKLNERGVTVDNVSIVNFQYSAQFDAAIEQKQVAQQDAQKAQYELQQAQLKAQANQVQDAALTPAILEQQAIAKWDGKLPNTLTQGSSVFSIPTN